MVLDLDEVFNGEILEVKYRGAIFTLANNNITLNQTMSSPTQVSFHGQSIMMPNCLQPTVSINIDGSLLNWQPYNFNNNYSSNFNEKSTFEKMVDPDLSNTNIDTSSYFDSDWGVSNIDRNSSNYFEEQAEREVNDLLGSF